jgi:hypothetical protein
VATAAGRVRSAGSTAGATWTPVALRAGLGAAVGSTVAVAGAAATAGATTATGAAATTAALTTGCGTAEAVAVPTATGSVVAEGLSTGVVLVWTGTAEGGWTVPPVVGGPLGA